MKPHVKRALAVAAVAALALTGCSGGGSTGETSAAGAGDGIINLGVAYATTNYNPSNTSSALAVGTNWHVVEGLYEFNMSDYSVHAALAAEDDPVKVSDTQYEVSLREGAKFSDGSDVTADDVVASFGNSMAEGNIYATMLDFIDSVEKKDDTTVTINLNTPFKLVKERLVNVKIVQASAIEASKEALAAAGDDGEVNDPLTSMPVGTGPWKYESITDAEVTAVPNEYYNGDYPAKAEKMVWNVQVDDTARLTALQSGSTDVMEAVPANDVQMLEDAGLTVEKKDGFNMPFLLFNTSKAPFNIPEVRQAFHYAIDTQKLIDNTLGGEATKATSFLPEDHPNYNKASTQYDYNPEKAKELLAEAGVTDLNVTLLTTDHTWISSLAPQILTDLEAVGITVNVQTEASASLYSNNLDVEDATFDVALAPGDPSVFGNDPALLVNWWYGDNIWMQQRSFWKESDPENFAKLQTIMDEAVTLEGDAQQAKFNEAYDLIAANVPIYPLFHRTMITAYNSEAVDGVTAISTTGLQLLSISDKQ